MKNDNSNPIHPLSVHTLIARAERGEGEREGERDAAPSYFLNVGLNSKERERVGERARNWERVIECVRGREIDDEERESVRVCACVHECESEREQESAFKLVSSVDSRSVVPQFWRRKAVEFFFENEKSLKIVFQKQYFSLKPIVSERTSQKKSF